MTTRVSVRLAAVALFLAVAGLLPAHGQQPAAGPITNADVVKLVKAGMAESLVLAAIRQASSSDFDRSADALIALKKAGVSDSVIEAVLQTRSASSPNPVGSPAAGLPSAAASSDNPNDPSAAHPAGIYLERIAGGTPSLVPLEPATFSQGKTGGVFASAMTGGLYKTKWKAVVRGARAQVRVSADPPTFYFYFEEKTTSLSHSGGVTGWLSGATSPNEFSLVQMLIKRDSRELVVGEYSAFGASTGARSEDTVPFTSQKLGPGIYKVVVGEKLGVGEFCFFSASASAPSIGAMAPGKLFDFGVDAGATPK